jgi:transcriptional regulator with XRE-family HTH domain
MRLYWQHEQNNLRFLCTSPTCEAGIVMSRIPDHPLRLARLKRNLSQQALAQRLNVQRSAVSAIEDGRTRIPTPELIDKLAHVLDAPDIGEEIRQWLEKPLQPSLRPSAQNLMLIPPYTLGQYYRTFQQWRSDVATTPTAFASMLRINPAIVRSYESGKYATLPDGLASKMLEAFSPYGFTTEYITALEGLPRS